MYTPSGRADKRDLVNEHKGLVRKLAGILKGRLPANVETDDLIQAGMIGLWEAAKSFDPAQEISFETFAGHRIRGAMLDELRDSDWVPRRVRDKLRGVEGALANLRQRLGREPQEGEVAKELQVSLEEYQSMLTDGAGAQLLYLEDLAGGVSDEGFLDRFIDEVSSDSSSRSGDPLDDLLASGFRAELVQAITDLPEREKLLMALYYEQNLNLREIGEVLGVSVTRVSQLHAQAVSRLRARLKG